MITDDADIVAAMISGSIAVRLAASSSPPILSTNDVPASDTSIQPLT